MQELNSKHKLNKLREDDLNESEVLTSFKNKHSHSKYLTNNLLEKMSKFDSPTINTLENKQFQTLALRGKFE